MKLTDIRRARSFEVELSKQQALERLEKGAKNTHQAVKRVPIFAELDLKHDISYITPAAKPGRSPFWVDRLLPMYGTWGRFPTRSESIRGFTAMDKVGPNTTVLIPMDGTKLGLCPSGTFYRSFSKFTDLGFEKLDNDALATWVNMIATGLNKTLKTKLPEEPPETFEQLNKRLIAIDGSIDRLKLQRALKDADITDDERMVLNDIMHRYTTSMPLYLKEKLDPEVNGFMLIRSDALQPAAGDHEVWFDQPCIAMKRSTYIDLVKDLNK